MHCGLAPTGASAEVVQKNPVSQAWSQVSWHAVLQAPFEAQV
jgi:hypothetical protein